MLNDSYHLNYEDKVNFGSYYTPLKYVQLAASWMKKHNIDASFTVFDPSCGYGSFFRLKESFPQNSYLGNDIDETACEQSKIYFPFARIFNKNLFENYSRQDFGLSSDDKIIIVGNPPYNDTTSQIHQDIKTKSVISMNDEIKSNDLGIASLLCYNKMKADYVLVLHPLSYLIKRANFSRGRQFFTNYKLVEHIIFCSQEFNLTSKLTGFPVLVGFYKRCEKHGLNYNEVLSFEFKTVEGKSFVLNDRQFISEFVNKYPNSQRFFPEILFYTLRDINALKRSRTFIKTRETNAVDVDPEKLGFYCYIDCFKRFANIPYYMGNFDIPLTISDFKNYESDFIAVSKYEHKEVFPDSQQPSEESIQNVKRYIDNAVNF